MNTDPIADLLTRIRNAHQANQESTVIPYSKLKMEIVNLIEKNGFLDGVKLLQQKETKNIKVILPKDRTFLRLNRISTPGRRIYKKFSEIYPSTSGYGIFVISTSKGLMTDVEARDKKLGGEVLCEIF